MRPGQTCSVLQNALGGPGLMPAPWRAEQWASPCRRWFSELMPNFGVIGEPLLRPERALAAEAAELYAANVPPGSTVVGTHIRSFIARDLGASVLSVLAFRGAHSVHRSFKACWAFVPVLSPTSDPSLNPNPHVIRERHLPCTIHDLLLVSV